MNETTSPPPLMNPLSRVHLRSNVRSIAVPILAVLTAVIIGSILILLAGYDPFKAFQGLVEGSLGSDVALATSLMKMAPLLLAGLAVAFAFKGGLFNIGAQGQLMIGSLTSAWAGFAITGLPPVVHVLVAIAAGILGGMIWGLIPGLLKAYTGAHEVISTIMLNYVAANLLEWTVTPIKPTAPAGPFAICNQLNTNCLDPKTPPILPSAYLPVLYQPSGSLTYNIHLGIFIAIAVALLIWIVLYRTTFGFQLRMLGLNPNAARYSGIHVARLTVLTMVISGGLAGLAGAIQTQGMYHEFRSSTSLTLGFDSIAVALLAGSNPIGIIPSAFLFGMLSAGGGQMQFESHVRIELIQVVQALILMFVAADQIIRYLYRIRATESGEKVKLSTGWGQR